MANSRFKVGDRVRFRSDNGRIGFAREQATAPYVVVEVDTTLLGPVKIRQVGTNGEPTGPTYGGYYDTRFEMAPAPADPNMDRSRIFSLAAAKAVRQELIASGLSEKDVRIRSRNWDNDGLYFAVDVTVPNANGHGNEIKKLYRRENVDGFLATLQPTDVEPFMESKRLNTVPVYQFRVEAPFPGSGLDFLPAPDGSYWWTETNIREKGGIVTHKGKRYRLGRKQFVPFVS